MGDINALDQDGRSPLAYALENENRIAVDWLLENGATVNPIDIEFAMVRNNFELLHRLLDATTDLNALDRSGRTMLFYALRNKNQIAVDWLLEHKATPVPRDFNFAMYRNDLVVLQTMLDINTDLNVPDQGGRTPLTYLVDSTG